MYQRATRRKQLAVIAKRGGLRGLGNRAAPTDDYATDYSDVGSRVGRTSRIDPVPVVIDYPGPAQREQTPPVAVIPFGPNVSDPVWYGYDPLPLATAAVTSNTQPTSNYVATQPGSTVTTPSTGTVVPAVAQVAPAVTGLAAIPWWGWVVGGIVGYAVLKEMS